jgi:hypothetical protein
MTMNYKERFEQHYYKLNLEEGIKKGTLRETWDYQQTKINQLLDYISLIGHQKELDRFLNNSKESI